MKIIRYIFLLSAVLILTSCYNALPVKPYLCKIHYLKQDMYVCEIQYRYPGGGPDRFFMRDPHIFGTICEDSMYNLAYRGHPAMWPRGYGDFREREWLVAFLPKGTPYIILQSYDPPDIAETYAEVTIEVYGGKYRGLQAEWPWFDVTREINRPYYFPAMRY